MHFLRFTDHDTPDNDRMEFTGGEQMFKFGRDYFSYALFAFYMFDDEEEMIAKSDMRLTNALRNTPFKNLELKDGPNERFTNIEEEEDER